MSGIIRDQNGGRIASNGVSANGNSSAHSNEAAPFATVPNPSGHGRESRHGDRSLSNRNTAQNNALNRGHSDSTDYSDSRQISDSGMQYQREERQRKKHLTSTLKSFSAKKDEDYVAWREKLYAQLRQAGPLTDQEQINYLVTCVDGDPMRLYQGRCKRRGVKTFKGVMEVFDQEYDVHREQHKAQVALHNMNFNPRVESFTQYLIRFNELADNAFPGRGQEHVDEMLFATLPYDIRSRLLADRKEKLGQEELREYIVRIADTLAPREEYNNPMLHLHQMTPNDPPGQTQQTNNANKNNQHQHQQ